MYKLPNGPTVYFDVDNTLVFSKTEFPDIEGSPLVIRDRLFTVHDAHVELLKDFKARGHTVVVWSAGGSTWAETVIKSLDLVNYIDVVVNKPTWFFDDKQADEFMFEGIRYYSHEGLNGSVYRKY